MDKGGLFHFLGIILANCLERNRGRMREMFTNTGQIASYYEDSIFRSPDYRDRFEMTERRFRGIKRWFRLSPDRQLRDNEVNMIHL